ncbi:hypothetical protein Pint_15973 [Pistacia integerrima]|uniref:Uncharacterized protein n=1 Tax=Pistacia integerrima TaxID=434235 RepID=A0ACC0ZFB1_9ROSI|nr:hypothetical protein Pint_15973 [Pistacia integerrima]
MSQLIFTIPKRLVVSPSLTLLRAIHTHRIASTRTRRTLCSNMSSNSSPSPLTHSIVLPCQLSQPVLVVAAPGLSEAEFRSAVESSLLNQWLKNLQGQTGILASGDMLLKQVLIQGVDMFAKRIGFLKFKADIFDKETGKKVPGIVFARGPAVAVLILLDSEGETYAILTEQVRVPTGRLILELPAGMLDDDKGNFVGTAVREVEEEIGINLNVEDMVDLTAFLDPSTGGRVFPSPVMRPRWCTSSAEGIREGIEDKMALFLRKSMGQVASLDWV